MPCFHPAHAGGRCPRSGASGAARSAAEVGACREKMGVCAGEGKGVRGGGPEARENSPVDCFQPRTPGAQAEGRAVDAAGTFSDPDAAVRRLGANLTATEPTGHLGCDQCRARPVGAVRARSDLLWANLTGCGYSADHPTLVLKLVRSVD